ncbi:MAG TPA: type I-U CRISPR-associated RAMP protein Csb1/Cas7u [Polyangiaceae bacterium]|nr:type I-U CRISPR-associated RAMP protein Csb1/Cas7u [Polyangiaceae bacterium]
MPKLSYEDLKNAVSGDAAGFRAITRLEPLGGPDDKLYPPTFGDAVRIPVPVGEGRDERRKSKYALEWRRVEGTSKLCVVLDSVASQANRMESALLDGLDRGELKFPFARVDFTGATHDDPALDLSTLGGDGYITTLEAPHRLADALLRDSLIDGKPFRYTDTGRRFTEASQSNATPLFTLCPASLVFGLWDSTGPKGGLGSKFQRAIVSEIIGVGVELGTRTSSRIDPTGIEKTEIYEAKQRGEGGSQDWTSDVTEAKLDKKQPVLLKRGGEKAGSPAVINHGNVKPAQDAETGGVTVDYAEQLTVLSLPALRRLRFAATADGARLDGQRRRQAEDAARTLLAALALAAIAYQRESGYDLRSRCALRALGPLTLELVPADGSDAQVFSLDREVARELLDRAKEAAAQLGMSWPSEPLTLTPAPKLVGLIRKSRQLTVVEDQAE